MTAKQSGRTLPRLAGTRRARTEREGATGDGARVVAAMDSAARSGGRSDVAVGAIACPCCLPVHHRDLAQPVPDNPTPKPTGSVLSSAQDGMRSAGGKMGESGGEDKQVCERDREKARSRMVWSFSRSTLAAPDPSAHSVIERREMTQNRQRASGRKGSG
eukprot:2081950-Rhodomonas_salina.1